MSLWTREKMQGIFHKYTGFLSSTEVEHFTGCRRLDNPFFICSYPFIDWAIKMVYNTR